jgi:hypothetical protein
MGPGAALEVVQPSGGLAWGLLADIEWLFVAVRGGFSIVCCEVVGFWEESSFMMGLLDMPDVGRWGD